MMNTETRAPYTEKAASPLLVAALCLALWPGRASAQDPPGIEPIPPGEQVSVQKREEPVVQLAPGVSEAEVQRRTRDYIDSGVGTITVHQIVQEMIDDFIADVGNLNAAAISPVAMRGVALTPNLSGAFGLWVEAEVIQALSTHSDLRVKRCVSCQALRTRLDGDDWIVSLGHVTQEELAQTARKIDVQAFVDVYVSYIPGANVVSMNVQIYRASDGKVLWTETYRSDATTAAILRSGDRVLTRDEARAELVRKLEQRPYYGYQVTAGFGTIPYASPTTRSLGGLMIGGRLYEKFGQDRRWLFGLHGESFINTSQTNAILGSFLGGTIQYQLNTPNLNRPVFRVGGIAQGFLAGSEGNSFAIEAIAEALFQFRLGASLGLMYFRPTTFANHDLGGVGFKGRLIFNW